MLRKEGNVKSIYFYINFLRGWSRTLNNKNHTYVLVYTFVHYILFRLKRLLKMNFHWQTLSYIRFKNILEKRCNMENEYIDYDSCIIANIKYFDILRPDWFFICSKVSLKKYKVFVVPLDDSNSNKIFVSEIMRHNLKNALCSPLETCFLLPVKDDVINFATEAKVSLIANPYESTNHLVDSLLENYFSEPRFLRKNDIFGIDVKEHIPGQLYSSANPLMSVIYFKVNSIQVNSDKMENDGSYILRGETTLIQEPNVYSYLPRKYFCHNETKEHSTGYPSSFTEPLDHLESCILPFISSGIQLPVKPVFLVKGPQGSGKRKLIQIASERLGLNILAIDFAEVQALTSAQTEAKLRIVLHNAEQCVPCILCLNNVEVFGKNSEGEKDERIISAFAIEINTLYNKRLEYPVIIIATTSESEIPAELQRMFIETIQIEHLNQNEKISLISWILAKRGLEHQLDLSKIAGLCSDFRVSDITALVLLAVKMQCKRTKNLNSLTLLQEDFDKAYEYMQSIYTDCKGTPRVPKIHWEDIGGLAELKHEIMRRIQLPLMNTLGFGQSGILLYGPPGTGKTLLAKAVATEYQLHFLSIKGPEVLNMYVGQSEKNVRQVFERARAAAPCIIFFDELDSLAPNRGRSGDSGGVMDRVVSQLLSEMDGLESAGSIFIVGATNRPDLIDPALLRPGRFDKMLYVGIHSDRASQLSVLKALTRRFKLKDGEELEKIVDSLPDHTTGADLYAVCSDAWLNAARRILSKHENGDEDKLDESELNPIMIELEDFLHAVRDLVPSVSEQEAKRYKKMQMDLQ